MKFSKILATGVIAAGLSLTTLGCSSAAYNEAHSNNAQTPPHSANIYPEWKRIATPSGYEEVIWGCVGKDGVYIGQSTGLQRVVPDDPNCT
jgi:hypothetical protein